MRFFNGGWTFIIIFQKKEKKIVKGGKKRGKVSRRRRRRWGPSPSCLDSVSRPGSRGKSREFFEVVLISSSKSKEVLLLCRLVPSLTSYISRRPVYTEEKKKREASQVFYWLLDWREERRKETSAPLKKKEWKMKRGEKEGERKGEKKRRIAEFYSLFGFASLNLKEKERERERERIRSGPLRWASFDRRAEAIHTEPRSQREEESFSY